MDELNRKLLAARYAYHKQIQKRYTDDMYHGRFESIGGTGQLIKLTPDQASEMYKRAMENYDGIIDRGGNAKLMTEEMDKGLGV